MLGALVGKNIKVNGRRTSMRLEPSIWDALDDIARRERMTRDALVSRIESLYSTATGGPVNLSSAVRVHIAGYYRSAATEDGHRLAGHGTGDPMADTSLDRPPEREDDPRRAAAGTSQGLPLAFR